MTIRFELARLEGMHLARLVDDFSELLGSSRDGEDPALQRLTPDVYPDDAEASRAFAESTRDDLLDRRTTDAATMRAALVPFDTDAEELSEDEALSSLTVAVAEDDLDAWLRTLTAIRLVIATRLGITSDDDHDSEDPRFGVYDWLGYRLEMLIQTAEA